MDPITQSLLNSQTFQMEKTSNQSKLGKDDFLRLLVTQLKNQNPLNPQDPAEMTSQLAQYTSLEQLYNINEGLDGLKEVAESTDRMSLLSMLDKNVVVQNSSFKLSDEGEMSLGYELGSQAESVQLQVKDRTGETVAHIEGKELSPGMHFVNWDRKDDNGDTLPPGEYHLSVSALQGEKPIKAIPYVQGKVTGVDFEDNQNILITNAGKFKLNEIIRIEDN